VSGLRASIGDVVDERRIRTRTAEWREVSDRIQVAMELTSRLNVLPFSDAAGRAALLAELLGHPLPGTATVHPPFYCTYGLGISVGEFAFIGHACSFLDLGGITIGDRAMIAPKVTLVTEGHPVEPAQRYDFITAAPIVIEDRVWIGAAATVLPGVTIGHDSVVGAGAVVAKDVPPLSVVTGPGQIERRTLTPLPESADSAAAYVAAAPSWTWVDAWLFAATADSDGGTSLSRLLGAADALNHAIPTRAELSSGLGALVSAGLIERTPDGFRTTSVGRAMKENWSGGLGRWQESLLPQLERLPRPDDLLPLTDSEVRDAYAAYAGRR